MRAEFTPKERIFAETVASGSSYAGAYRLAYNVTSNSAERVGQSAYELVKRPEIAALIAELQKEAAKKFRVTREWLMNFHYQRIVYDPGEITRMIVGACRHCYGDNFGFQWREPDYMAALEKAQADNEPLPDIAGGFGFTHNRPPHPECPKCDGRGSAQLWIADTADLSPAARLAFEGIKETRNGIEIKMADKHAAAVELARLAGLHVEQIKVLEDIPDDAQLAELSPAEVAETYRRMVAGGAGTRH